MMTRRLRANRPGVEPRFCSRSCFHVGTAAKMITKSCQTCGKPMTVISSQATEKRFCGASCSARWRMAQPEVRAKIFNRTVIEKTRQSLKRWWAQDGDAQRAQRERITQLNPMSNLESRRKMRETIIARGITFNDQTRGGNGKPLPRAHQALLDVLGDGYVAELSVGTGERGPGRPAKWTIDIAHMSSMTAIEVDGKTHRAPAVIERDRRKDTFLASRGWRVLRFTNEEILSSIDSVVARITSHSMT